MKSKSVEVGGGGKEAGDRWAREIRWEDRERAAQVRMGGRQVRVERRWREMYRAREGRSGKSER